jgi:hypothetical protein
MAQDSGLDFSAGPSVTLLSSDLTTGSSSAWTSAVDFGTPTPFGMGYLITLTTLTSATGKAVVEVAWSHDNTAFSDSDNSQIVDIIQCTASTDKTKAGTIALKARYAKFRIVNNSGGTIDGTASNTSLTLYDLFGDLV